MIVPFFSMGSPSTDENGVALLDNVAMPNVPENGAADFESIGMPRQEVTAPQPVTDGTALTVSKGSLFLARTGMRRALEHGVAGRQGAERHTLAREFFHSPVEQGFPTERGQPF